MKRLLQFFTLLALALVGGAQAMLAETEAKWVTMWNNDFTSNPVETGWAQAKSRSQATNTIEQKTLTDGGYYVAFTNEKYNTVFTYSLSSIKQFSDINSDNKNYKFGMDFALTRCNTNGTTKLTIRKDDGTENGIDIFNISAIGGDPGKYSTTLVDGDIYINGSATAEATKIKMNTFRGGELVWYHIEIKSNSTDGTVLTLTRVSDESETSSYNISTDYTPLKDIVADLSSYNQTCYGGASFANFTLAIPANGEVCPDPTYNIIGVNGKSRIMTLSCTIPDATIYYSTEKLEKGAEGWTKYENNITTDATEIYAYAESNGVTSDIVTIETGAGTEIKLNTPTIKIESYKEGYYSVSFSSSQTNLSLVPSAISYSYNIDGGDVQIGEKAQVAEGSKIAVVVTADGYANSTEVVWASDVRPTDLQKIWGQDYTNLTSDEVGTGTPLIELASEISFSCHGREFYKIVGYNHNSNIVNVTVNENVGLTKNSFKLRRNNNYSGILQNVQTGYLGINNLLPGQIIIITVWPDLKLSAEEGAILEEGMSTSSEYYFTATGTTASFVIPKGTYNYVQTIEVKGKTETITLPADYTYSTFCSTKALDFTDNADVEAYIAQVENDGVTVTLTKVNQVPAGEGVILKKTGDNTTAAVKVLASAEALSNNALVGVTEANTVSLETLAAAGNAYVLVSDEKFSKVSEGASGYISAGKAYLEYTPVAGASVNSLRISFGEPTAVADVEAKQETGDNAIYNVQGIRVSKPTAPGMYIMNGKAFIVK